MNKRAIFFDRDDTLIKDVPYSGNPALVQLMPHVREALSLLKAHGLFLFIISNQSGVGLGLISEEQVQAVNQELLRQLREDFFSGIYLCFAAPDDEKDDCRKPKPGMIWRARDDHQLNLAESFLVGDKPADILCAENAGCRSVLLLTGTHGENIEIARQKADFVASDLLQAAEWICQAIKGK